MVHSNTLEQLPEQPSDEVLKTQLIDYYVGLKDGLGDDSPHTKEQILSVKEFSERNQYFNTSAYSEAEPDIYAVTEPDYENIPVLQHNNATPIKWVKPEVNSNNNLTVELDRPTRTHELVAHTPDYLLAYDHKNDGYIVVLPAKTAESIKSANIPVDINTRINARPITTETNIDVTPEIALKNAREKVAALSIELRSKHSKKLNQELRTKYEAALDEYKNNYDIVNAEGEFQLKGLGHEHSTIVGLLAFANAKEHSLFTEAESNAFSAKNPRLGRVANFWAKTGIVKRALLSGGAGMAVTTVATGLAAASGVGLVAAGAIGLSVKAAKSVSMYKLNKGAQTIKQFDKKAQSDNAAVSKVEDHSKNMSDVRAATSDMLITTLRSRTEKDQKENRKKLIISVGAVAAGAVLGSIVHSFTHGGGGNQHASVRPAETTAQPPVTETTIAHTPQTTVVPRPTATTTPNAPATTVPTEHTPTTTPQTTSPTSGNPNPTGNAPVVPEKPTVPVVPQTPPVAPEAPLPNAPVVEVPQLPHPSVDITRSSWSLAHDFAPGHETQYMQGGIDKFNSIHHTNFALTPHNGSTWIIDNNMSINPAQMQELNLLMIEESLKTA